MRCCTWNLHHCLFRHISSSGLSRGQRRVPSSSGPGGFSGSLPELKLGWCWRLQLWLSAPPQACCSASWPLRTQQRLSRLQAQVRAQSPSKAQHELSLNEHWSDALIEGSVETYDFLLFFIRRVVHVNPLPVVIWLLTETGTFPPICEREHRQAIALCWVSMTSGDKSSESKVMNLK